MKGELNMTKQINFDMDGTIADLYSVEGWLSDLRAEKTRPYREARPLLNMSVLARRLHKLQAAGWKIVVISWTSMNGSKEYNELVKVAKLWWLHKHLPSVEWDEINIVPYGEPKHEIGEGILFDDKIGIRNEWGDNAYDENEILTTLKGLM